MIFPKRVTFFALILRLGSEGFIVLVGSYLFWVMSSFAVLHSDMQRHPDASSGWGLWQWGATCLFVGGLALPLYFWMTHGTGAALTRGIFLGFVIVVLTFAVRLGLSLYLQVPLV